MIEVALFFASGILLGAIAGIMPGLHPNLIAAMVSGIAYGIFPSTGSFIIFMVAMGVSNSMISFLPSVFLGSPDENTVLSASPAHRLLRKGMGMHALRLSVIGGVLAMCFCVASMPLAIVLFPAAYSIVRPYTHIMLAAFVMLMIATERKKLTAAFFFFSSGALGMLGSSLPISPDFYLLPVLSGLFGAPILLISMKMNADIPPQSARPVRISSRTASLSSVSGSLSGMLAGLLPGVGPSQAAFVADAATKKKRTEEGFLISLGSVTMANTLFSFIALWLIGNPRSGLAVAIGNFADVGVNEFMLMVASAAAACGISAVICIKMSGIFSRIVPRLNYPLLCLSIMAYTALMVAVFTGAYGMLIFIITSCLGIAASLSQTSRSHLMGVLILPTMLFFAGI